MALKGLYLLLCCAGVGVTHKLMKTLCNGPTCLHLYQDINSDGLTWNQSYKMCTDLDQELLRIGSSQSQTRVEKLLQDISKESGVWLAGQRNVDDTWRYMNGTVFSKLGYCILSSACYNLRKVLCEKPFCFHLYELEDNIPYMTWNRSYEACREQGLDMIRIESNQTQITVEKLLQDIPEDTQRQIWIAGTRSPDNNWRYMNGTVFRNKVQAAISGVDDCLFVKLDETKKPNYTPDNCDEKNSHSVLLCQADQGKCDSSDFKSGNKCYKKTKYDGSDSNKVDWYDGQTYCSNNDIQGDIAYSYLNNNSEIKKIFDLFTGRPDPVQLWLGVRRRIWSWETDYSHEGNKPVIKYFNWGGRNIDASNNNCIYINMNEGSKWFSQSCNGFNLPYFLCMNETTSDSTTSTRHSTSMGGVNSDNFQTAQSQTEAKSQSTKTTTMTTLINGRNKQQNIGQKEFKSVYLIAVVVSVVIVLTIIIGVTVFLVLKKRNRITKEHGYVHNDVHHSPELPNTNDPEYADIGPTKDDDTINPYGVTPAAQTVDNDIRHNKAPSGDLYAISSKQVAQSEGNINKNKDGINPEVLYARPNKKKIQDTVIEETIKSRNDADTEMPSAGENSSGSKHTEHFETETGDVYAKVTI